MTMTNIIQRVTYPMFSHMQSDQHKMDEYYLLTMKVAALFIFPLMAGVAILAQPLLQLVRDAMERGCGTCRCAGFGIYALSHSCNKPECVTGQRS
jgi:hypothetical protein